MSGAPAYAVITPARNEAENLPRLALAIEAQRLQPRVWVIIDDGSDDGTRELALELARDPRVILVDAEPLEGALADGRRQGRALETFRLGVAQLTVPVDVVVKVDADTSFDSLYFERLVGRFGADPRLGIASGTCHELERGRWVARQKSESTVWGASRAYRRQCLPVLDELEPKMGWDGLDELKAQLRGFRTETFSDLRFDHHRPEGGRERGRLQARSVQGRASWYMGYRPSFIFARALYNSLRRDPAALAMVWGYAAAGAARTPRCPDGAVVDALRERQRARTLFRRLGTGRSRGGAAV